ncbi:MAG: aminotransferase class I/II-fold pyridoxal phosphate-dependent enzyme [Lachnospiraceae bacterium]|nr:aminotransferase class I/II-fold pyridoxal phosphate-dependent enzyme [Lachnospiraceae bacterium]
MNMVHGGDIYRNSVTLDFSVNVNPLGMPEGVKQALLEAIEVCNQYPDIRQQELKIEVGKLHQVLSEHILFGNGASELFMAIVHTLKPKKTVIPIPSFYGYEHAAKACESEICYYEMQHLASEEEVFGMEEELFQNLDESVDVLFLANPNNPVGGIVPEEWMERLFLHCRKQGIYVILDECFADFCGQEVSLLTRYVEFPNVIWVRAFTKIFSIPGVRIGYLINGDEKLLKRIERQLPEWNLSTFAQKAGIACAREKDFINQTREYVEAEGRFLAQELERMGLQVYPYVANFLLVYTEAPLYEKLLEKGILIRDCSNFRGLSKGYYRIAIKKREENQQLLTRIGEIL